MFRKKETSLAIKFNTLSVALVLMTAILISLFEINHQQQIALSYLVEEGKERSRLIAEVSEYAIYVEDIESLERIISKNDIQTTYIALLRPNNSVIVKNNYQAGDSEESTLTVNLPIMSEVARVSPRPAAFHEDLGNYLRFIHPVISLVDIDPDELDPTTDPLEVGRGELLLG